MADKKGVTSTQLALAWLIHQSPVVVPIPGSTRVEGVKESLGALDVRLSKEDLDEIRKVAEEADVRGGRYNDHVAHTLEG